MTTTTYSLDVEQFTLSDKHATRHYVTEHDLFVHCKEAYGGGERAALILIELGIDGYNCHRATLAPGWLKPDPEYRGEDYYDSDRDPVTMLGDAIETLTALQDRLAEAHR